MCLAEPYYTLQSSVLPVLIYLQWNTFGYKSSLNIPRHEINSQNFCTGKCSRWWTYV